MNDNYGWFGNLTSGLSSLATTATPLVTAFRGAKAPVANATPDAASVATAQVLAAPPRQGGLNVNPLVLLAAGLAGIGCLLFLLLRKGK